MESKEHHGKQSKICEPATRTSFGKHRIMAKILTDPNCKWNNLFFEWMRLGVEYDKDWYTVYIDYDALDDLPCDLPHFYVGTNLEQLKDGSLDEFL